MKRLFLLAPLLCILGCDSTSTGSTGSAGGGSMLTAATTFTVAADAMVPIVGGYHEPRCAISRDGVPDTIVQTTLNFLGSNQNGNLKYSGSILVNGIAQGGTYTLDTAYFSFHGAGANLSFQRFANGEDTCYYSSISGSFTVSGWSATTLHGTAGHLATGTLDATMAFPWSQPGRRSCPETLPVRMGFTEAFIRDAI